MSIMETERFDSLFYIIFLNYVKKVRENHFVFVAILRITSLE
jgi:hypothetical protein